MSTHTIHFQRKIRALELSQISAVMEKIIGTQERVQNSRDKRAIGV